MRAWCQLGSNRSCVNSEQTNAVHRLEGFSAKRKPVLRYRKALKLRALVAVAAGVALLICGSISSMWAQDIGAKPPTAAVAPPPKTTREFGSQVDESIRFGVSARELYERIEPALVEVLWGGANSRINSMGFKVDGEGTYATVIPAGASTEGGVVLRGNGVERDGKVLVIDEPTGLCLIGTEKEKSSASAALLLRPVGDRVYPGTLVFSVNRPGVGDADVCVAGRLAGRDSVYHGVELPTSYYRINMHLLHGTLGSPLLDESGGVVGILTGRRLKESSEHHALPSPVLEKLIRDHQRAGRSSRAWIGASFHLKSTTPQVMSVRENSPAAQSGLRSGDVILRVGKARVADLNDLVDAFYIASIGKSLELEVLRGIEKLTMKLVPGELPTETEVKESATERSGVGSRGRGSR